MTLATRADVWGSSFGQIINMTDISSISGTTNFILGASQAANITSLAGAQAARVAAASEAKRRYGVGSSSDTSEDQVDVSEAASEVAFYMGKIRSLPVRQELIDRVKAEIAKGTYDTPQKLSAAIDEMLNDWA